MGGYGMNCMRCGREIPEEQVFCSDCLEEMKKCPVKPDTPVRLPRRPDPVLRRTVRKKGTPEEEQIRSLKKQVRLLAWLLILAAIVIVVLSIPAIRDMVGDSIQLLPGQNYSSAAGGA